MARFCGCDPRAVLAGAIICWAVVEGVAVAQEGAEVVEDLGGSYLLARRTTSYGSIIETLLFSGQAIVTEIAVPERDAGTTVGTTGAIARTAAGSVNASPDSAAGLPPGIGPGFGGTWLTGDVIDDYLVLHRTRASDPVTHEIFYHGRKVGSVTEVDPSSRTARIAGRNSFAFESIDDRFVVRLTQPDGTIIRATTEHDRFSGQVIERAATVPVPVRSGLAMPSAPAAIETSRGRSLEPQRLARPQEPEGAIMVEEPHRQGAPTLPEAVPLPRAFPLSRIRPAVATAPAQTASPSRGGSLSRSTPEHITVAPTTGRIPASTSVNTRPAISAAARPVAPASTITAPVARPKPAAPSASAPPPAAAPTARPVAASRAVPPAGTKPAVAIATQPPAAAAAKPSVRDTATGAPAVKPKPTLATEHSRPLQGGTAKPVAPVAKRSPPPD